MKHRLFPQIRWPLAGDITCSCFHVHSFSLASPWRPLSLLGLTVFASFPTLPSQHRAETTKEALHKHLLSQRAQPTGTVEFLCNKTSMSAPQQRASSPDPGGLQPWSWVISPRAWHISKKATCEDGKRLVIIPEP
jgi:hypothetical protein